MRGFLTNKLLQCSAYSLMDLSRRCASIRSHDVLKPFGPELFVERILRFAHTVRVDDHHGAGFDRGYFSTELKVRKEADRGITAGIVDQRFTCRVDRQRRTSAC